jgi:plastocyanin
VSREPGRRIVYGIGIPVAAAVFIAIMLWAMSRILLAVDPAVAPLVALGFAANVLVAAAAAAVLGGRRAFVVITSVVVVSIVAGGIAGAMVGEFPVERHVAQGEHPTGETPGPPPPTEGCEPAGKELQIAAPPGADLDGFDTTCLAAPAGKAFTVEFTNEDVPPHDWALYRDPSATEQMGGGTVEEPVASGDSTTYEVDPLDPGDYFYRCDFHPTTMTGTLTVE